MKRAVFTVAILGLCLAAGLSGAIMDAWADAHLRIDPPYVHIRESFQGQPLTLSAAIPDGASAVVELRGQAKELVLLRQGRRGGLWMSVGEVKIANCPSLYFLLTTEDLKLHADIEKQFGYDVIKNGLTFQGAIPQNGAASLFSELVKLKEHEGLFGIFPGALKKTESKNGQTWIRGQIFMPGNVSAGVYKASLFILNSGHVTEQRRVDLSVEMKGMPAILATLAHEHAILYGVLAVVIAVVTGFVMGFIFKGRGAH